MIVAFAIIYVVWGSTYLANWYAIQEIPPFLMSGTRFIVAGAVLFAVSHLIGRPWPSVRHWKNTAYIGTLLLACGTGLLVWSEKFISSGIVALMAAFQPLLVVLLMWRLQDKKPGVKTLLGTLLGVTGMVFLVGQDQFVSSQNALIGIAAILVALYSWGYASVKVADMDLPGSKIQSAGMQMLAGGAALVLVGLVLNEPSSFHASALSTRAVWSWLYLVVLGSIVAFSAFNYLLVKSAPDKVATANYVNPVVAMLLGWGLNNEQITGQSLIAAAFMLTGVVFINTRVRWRRVSSPHPIGSIVCELEGAVADINILPSPQPNPIIARIWQGLTTTEQSTTYLQWAKQYLVPEFNGLPGNMGLTLAHRREEDLTRMFFVSYWSDYEAIEAFAGKDYQKARFFPKEKEMLVDYQVTVEHRYIKVG